MDDTCLLDIKSDYIFKLVFGSEKNKDVLISFLNAVFKGNPKVRDIQLKNTEIAKILKNNRTVRLDVKADIGNRCFVDVEIQVRNTGDIIDRGIQYLSSMMVENFDAKSKEAEDDDGISSYKFPKVIGIWILAKSITERKSAVNEAVMTFQKNQMDDYKIASDKIRLFTIELPKFNPKKLDRKNMLDVWMTFLKDPLNDEAQQVKEVHKALDTLKEVSADEEVRELYRLRNETEFGYISEMTIKSQKAKEEGRAEGAREKAIETARKMLQKGLDFSDISEFTGLSPEEIGRLK